MKHIKKFNEDYAGEAVETGESLPLPILVSFDSNGNYNFIGIIENDNYFENAISILSKGLHPNYQITVAKPNKPWKTLQDEGLSFNIFGKEVLFSEMSNYGY